MKFKAFSNPLLNLGSMDIELASGRQLSLLTCVACGFTGEAMFYSNCNHAFCTDCLLLLEPVNEQHEEEVVKSHCLLCRCASSAMRIQIKESFVAQLECVCSQCRITLQLCELKAHLRSCMILPQPPPGSLALNDTCAVAAAAAKQTDTDDASLGYHSTSAIRNDGDAGQAMSDCGSPQSAASFSVTAAIGAVRREVVDMMSNDKNELRGEFTQKIEAVLTDMSSLTTQLRPCRRSFQLDIKLRMRRGDWYTTNVCVNDITFGFNLDPWMSEITANVCAIGDQYVNSFRSGHVAAAVVPKEVAVKDRQTLGKRAIKTPLTKADLRVGNDIRVKLQPHHQKILAFGTCSTSPSISYPGGILEVIIEFDWEP